MPAPLIRRFVYRLALVLSLLFPFTCVRAQTANEFTCQFGAPVPAPVTLVSHTNLWSFRRGTTAPQADWQTAPDAALDTTWTNAPGGFGYGDSGIVGESTPVNINGVCSTLYIRYTFNVPSEPPPDARIQLRVDYDDGFVAYLDGQELRRVNLTNGPGTFVSNMATTGGNSHEASCCNAPTHPPELFDCGAVSNRLAPGTHVLALIGVNQSPTSSDFHIIPDLLVTQPAGTGVNGNFLTIVQTNSVLIWGSNTIPTSTRVMVNGDDAEFNPATATWSRTQPLQAGVNELNILATDADGRIQAATNRMVIADLGSVATGVTLALNTVWAASNGLVRLTNNVIVPPGGTLQIEPGVVILAGPNCSILATNASVIAQGTADAPTYFLPADGSTTGWGGIIIAGTSGILRLQHVEMVAGHIQGLNGANALVEDSYLHDYLVSVPAIIHTLGVPNPVSFTLRRTHIARYHELLFQVSTNLLEDSLFEYLDYSGDGTDFDAGQPGSHILRCTFRQGTNFNTDALDMGEYSGNGVPTRGVIIDSCLLHNFIDKGVSMGVNVDLTVTNCVIYNVDAGIAVKDLSVAGIFNNTISDVNYGFDCYNKASPGSATGGGLITNSFNNILWNCSAMAVSLLNGSTLTASHSDFYNTNFTGEGNVSVNPGFVDASRHNYRLSPGSPLLGAGLGGSKMGATYPVGGLPSAPLNFTALTLTSNEVTLNWTDDADNEERFEIQRSTDAKNWQAIGTTQPDATSFVDAGITPARRYYYRARATNASGASRFTGIAGAIQRPPVINAGGVLANNTVWNGSVMIWSNLTVPSGLTLTIAPGTTLNVANGVVIAAQAGGSINIQGAFTNRVVLRPMTAGGSWGGLNASGSGSTLTVRHAELDHGAIQLGSQATGIIEDCYVHHVSSAIVANSALSAVVRRCHVSDFSETIYNFTPVLVEDCLLENMSAGSSDALEIQGALAAWGCTVRRCTARNSTGENSDAYDANGSSGVLFEDCIAHNFTDKGVSLGAAGEGGAADYGITVRNCLLYNLDTGVAIKDGTTLNLIQNTIANSAIGLNLYQKFVTPADGGHVTNGYNNILWGNTTGIKLENNSSLVEDYSNLQDTNYPGFGNISQDPLFINPAQHDFRLAANSPCLTSGQGGAPMGVVFPVGVYITAPASLTANASPSQVHLSWQDNSPSEAVYEIERSFNGGTFEYLVSVDKNTTSFVDSDLAPGTYRYRIRGVNLVAQSEYATSPAISFGLPRLELGANGQGVDANGNFWIQANVPTNMRVILERSTNLSEWLPIQTNNAGAAFFEYSTPLTTSPRFYRLLLTP